jgi:ribosomal protein S18 acetylase RimI-like enzyme
MSFTIEPAGPEQQAEAFRLAFQHLAKADQETRVSLALDMIRKQELDPAGLWVACEAGAIRGALLCQPMAGAAGLVWPPQVVDRERRILEDLLVQHASAWLRRQGARLAQALLPPGEAHLGIALERNGFDHVTTLSYLRAWLEQTVDEGPTGLTFQGYASDPARFEQTLLRTYVDTQDCPELTGVRTTAEIMAGHRAQGPPELWWLAQEAGEPVGVLFLAETPEWKSMDLAYVGIVPEARGRRLGRQLLLKALAEARRAAAEQITVSVDGRNQPARQLYLKMGFEPFDSREVFLAIWDRAG